jgi:hypothetical protein
MWASPRLSELQAAEGGAALRNQQRGRRRTRGSAHSRGCEVGRRIPRCKQKKRSNRRSDSPKSCGALRHYQHATRSPRSCHQKAIIDILVNRLTLYPVDKIVFTDATSERPDLEENSVADRFENVAARRTLASTGTHKGYRIGAY